MSNTVAITITGPVTIESAMQPHAAAPMEPKLCINCRHHLQIDQPAKGMSEHQCAHPRLANVVTGAHVNCEDARTRICGPDGVLFGQKNTGSDLAEGVA